MTETTEKVAAEYTPEFPILYEDNHIIVVLKPQMTACCPDESRDKNLLDMVKEYIKIKYNKPGNVYVGLVHRLDRPTGGVMVYAKTSKAAARLTDGLQNGEFEKKYLLHQELVAPEYFQCENDFEQQVELECLNQHDLDKNQNCNQKIQGFLD